MILLGIKSHDKLVLEIKEEGEEFEKYDPNILKLRIVQHSEGREYDFKRLDALEYEELEVNKKQHTVTSLEQMICEKFGISEGNLVIFIRNIHYNNTIRPEIYNMPWRKPKLIADCSSF